MAIIHSTEETGHTHIEKGGVPNGRDDGPGLARDLVGQEKPRRHRDGGAHADAGVDALLVDAQCVAADIRWVDGVGKRPANGEETAAVRTPGAELRLARDEVQGQSDACGRPWRQDPCGPMGRRDGCGGRRLLHGAGHSGLGFDTVFDNVEEGTETGA